MKAFQKKQVLLLLFLGCFVAVSMAEPAIRIVSLAQSLTKNLVDLDAENSLVGCTNYCRTSQEKAIVASAVTVNVERVIALKPNLVIATDLTNKASIETLRKFGINIVVYSTPISFEEICAQFLDLGHRIGKSDQASNVIFETRQKVEKLKAMPHKPLRMCIQIGANPLFVVIPNSFMNDYIRFAGAINIAADLKLGSITRETVLYRNPDVLFIVTMGGVGSAEKSQWESMNTVNAVRNKRVFILNSDKACMPSPVSFAETLETILYLIK